MSVAFLIIDVQKAYVDLPGFRETFLPAHEYINHVSALFREKKQPVVHIQHLSQNQDLTSEGYMVSERITQQLTDIYIQKTYGNAFWKTDLENKLKELEVDYVICCGLSAVHCVLGTYNGALERGFGAAMLQNGLVARTKEEIDLVHKEFNVTDYRTIQYLLQHKK